MTGSDETLQRLERRLERERRSRRQAETIAEETTSKLYASGIELHRLNDQLAGTNDELQALNQSMRDFVAIASHDLRGPLTSILGFTSVLLSRWETMPDADKRNALEIVQRQGKHLDRLVGDLLTISKIEAGALDVQREVVELHEEMQQAIEDFNLHANEIQFAVPMLLQAVVDPDHLRRILLNFMTNAFKYGQPPVRIEAADAGSWVEIRVRDNGDGVPDDFRPRLFARFSRAEGKSRGLDGTGLGLSIVQGLARANGGETWYEPNQPHGSCFGLRLPKTAA